MFTPLETTVGAILLYLATTSLLFDAGAILGASGQLRRLLADPQHEVTKRTSTSWFFGGMTAAVAGAALLTPRILPSYPSFDLKGVDIFKVLASGLLTGWGTKHSGGCTSGHMLCGIGRLSPRSLLATAIFFPVAVATFQLTNPSLVTSGCPSIAPCYTASWPDGSLLGTLAVSLLLPMTLSRAVHANTVCNR